MKLTINLATRRYLNLRQLNAFLVAGLLLLSVLAVLKVREVAYNQAELGRVGKLLAAPEAKPGSPAVTQAQLQALKGEILFANGLIQRKSVDWLQLLDHLEEVVPDGVALTEIAPPGRDQLFKISGVTRSFGSLRRLLENLEQSKNFSEVYLLSQSEAKIGQTQEGITFAVVCKVAK
jgi:type IV pilus assembly protein PilN